MSASGWVIGGPVVGFIALGFGYFIFNVNKSILVFIRKLRSIYFKVYIKLNSSTSSTLVSKSVFTLLLSNVTKILSE